MVDGATVSRRGRRDPESRAEQWAARVAALCRLIEGRDEPPSLEEVARFAGWSPSHTLRVFKRVTGMTPKAYAAAHRANGIRARLRGSGSVTEAIYDAGFGSSGRFYEKSGELLGMKPKRYRDGGAGEEIRFAVAECSLGAILVAATTRGVCAISLGDDPEELVHDLERRFPNARLVGADTAFEGLVAKVVGLVEHPRVGADLPLDIRGTAFQQRVWDALRKIPAGRTATYTEIARAIGAPTSARAVARACATNEIAIAIPCHRVVRTDGDPSGYRWGIDRKRALLAQEANP